ncbi:MAG: polysaccharide deacetylase 2 family uncharacterized protein YibQ [Oleiphilaceae bacterium]|jgi:polysaccharide deacetylase 2 family uncharacterized protein YibQ
MNFFDSFRNIVSTLRIKFDLKVLIYTTLSYTIFLLCFSIHVKADFDQQPTIAIIIDDMGHSYDHGVELINLPFPLTLSFLPERPFTNRLIEMANFHQKEIMLHVPMQNSMGFDLGYGGLNKNMSETKLKQTLISSFQKINYMVGLNNHMGSILTTDPMAMKWVMETVRQYPFYFLDSRTSSQSVAANTATKFNIPNLSRDIFLDHVKSRDFIQGQFLKLLKLAKKNGTAIAIGHPHRETVEYLTWALSKLDEKGIAIASLSSLWQIRNPQRDLQKELAKRPTQRTSQIRLADYTY